MRRLTISCAGFVMVLALVAAPASAKLNAGDLADGPLRTKTFRADNTGLPVGGYAKCPKGTRVVTGGAYLHKPGRAPVVPTVDDFDQLNSSAPTPDGRRWYAAGRPEGQTRLTAAVRCLPKNKLRAVETEIVELDPVSAGPAGTYLSCPAGMETLAGGAVWHQPETTPVPADSEKGLLASSTVTGDGLGWYADGTDNYVIEDERLRVIVRCFPAQKLAGTHVEQKTDENVPDDGIGGSSVRCPRQQPALTGGGFWHASGLGPDPTGNQGIFGGSNAFTRNGRAWLAAGLNFNAGGTGGARSFTVYALCLRGG